VVLDAIRDESGNLLGYAKITRDISERREHEERLLHLAHFDTLTELPNRFSLRAKIDDTIASRSCATVLMLDLDGFKEVNDTLGHTAGDVVLKAAGARIQNCIGDQGIVGRPGGDEFTVLLPNVGNPTVAAKFCERLIEAFRMPFVWETQDVNLGLSIGVAMSPAHGSTAEELLTSADLALYRAKAERRQGFCVFEHSFRQAAIANRHCDQELRQAVNEGQLKLFYQPQVSLVDYRVIGAEALLRWQHPKHGLLAPAAFLHVLESGSLAPIVGEWVIREAAAQAATIRSLGFANFWVSVNLFGSQLRKGNLTDTVYRALKDNALPPEALELEITENIFIREDEAIIAPLRALRAAGVGVAFDDYGTGYASLSLLKRFPLSRLKIDKSFVDHLCDDSEDAAVVKAIVYLAENFGLQVTAEGIELEEQRTRLRELGCEIGQGYLFGRPMPLEHMMDLLAGHGHDAAARWPELHALNRSSTSSAISKFA
jgi:diguanylate cyclase (GGDEF)-like protein